MKYIFAHIQTNIIGNGPNLPQMIRQAVGQIHQQHGARLLMVFPIVQRGETTGALLIAEVPEPPLSHESKDID